MRIAIPLLSALMVTVTGCISSYNFDNVYRPYLQQNMKKEYQLGQPLSVGTGGQVVGASLVIEGIYEVINDYQPPFQYNGKHIFPLMKKGAHFYTSTSDIPLWYWGQPTIPGTLIISSSELTMEIRDKYGVRREVVPLVITPYGVVKKSMDGRIWGEDTLFKALEPQTQKYTLTYTGKEKDIITMTYRDYIVGGNHVPYEEVIRHDLSRGNMFTFRDVTVEILQATETKLDYRVISDNDLIGIWKGGGKGG